MGGYSSATSWSADTTPMGSHDWRSTRDSVVSYSMCHTTVAAACATLVSNATLSARSWVNRTMGSVRMLAATVSNEGGNPFARSNILPRPVFTAGDEVQGTVRLQM